MSSNTAVATAQLAIYAVLTLPTIYVLFLHGRSGFLGWFYLLVFSTLRIVGGAMLLHDPLSTGATVITSIGISPLLLATLGLLHEGRASRNPHLKRHVEVPFVVALHLLIASALGLIGAGASALTSSNPQLSSLLLVKIGIVTLLLSWLLILGLAIISLQPRKGAHERNERQAGESRQYRNGTILLYVVTMSLFPSGVRVLYGVISIFVQSPTLNSTTGSLALKVCLSVVPEMVVVVLLVAAGLLTGKKRGAGGFMGLWEA